ncbi:hypothetical protein C8R45DRAFT_533666 [Mycena sanguinolenta]|nr:hypothetical protein C8R45DRAFT_533666 [Mycena sanguinolenta]
MKFDMAALLYRPFVSCPWCGLPNKAALWVYCDCGKIYQASAASLTESQDILSQPPTAFIQEPEHAASSFMSDDMTTKPGLRDEETVEVYSYAYKVDMASLRKVHVIFDDSDSSEESYSSGATPTEQLPVPNGFARPINVALAYTLFEKMKVQDMDSIVHNPPRMPAVLRPHDVYPADWNRMIRDLCLAWTGRLPVPGGPHKKTRLAAELIDLWNTAFFFHRGVEVVLYKGRQRRTGPSAGLIDIQLYDEDTDSTVSSSSPKDSDSDSGPYPPVAYMDGEKNPERKRRRKEKEARRKQKAREEGFALYLSCVPLGGPGAGRLGGPPSTSSA